MRARAKYSEINVRKELTFAATVFAVILIGYLVWRHFKAAPILARSAPISVHSPKPVQDSPASKFLSTPSELYLRFFAK